MGMFEGDAWLGCPPGALPVLDVDGAGFAYELSWCSGTCFWLRLWSGLLV